MGYTVQVRQFTKACNDDLPAHPQKMTDEGIAFIRQMVNDELDELVEAQNVTEQADAAQELLKLGKDQAPCLHLRGEAIFEADAITRELANLVAPVA